MILLHQVPRTAVFRIILIIQIFTASFKFDFANLLLFCQIHNFYSKYFYNLLNL